MPQAERIQTASHAVFGVIYLVTALHVLSLLPATFKGMTRMLRVPDRIKNQEWTSNWKLKRARGEFATLKDLHENGLISDEAFTSRKDALAARLRSIGK